MSEHRDSGLFRLKPIGLSKAGGSKPCTLLQAARHNLREQQDERGARAHIVAERSPLNVVLWGPERADEVAALASSSMAVAGVVAESLRRDHVQAIELLFSLPASTSINVQTYFEDCTTWAAEQFGANHVLSSVVHVDEAAPHCHVLVLPLVNGRMNARALKTRQRVREMSASFADKVAGRYGLKTSAPQRMTAAWRRAAADAVLGRMNSIRDPAMQSQAWQLIRVSIEANPAPYADALGLNVPEPATAKKLRTMAQVFTSPGRGARQEPEARH